MMRTPATSHSLLAAAAAAASLLALPAGASAASCTFDPATAKVTVGASAANSVTTISRSAAGAIRVDGITCGAATVTTTDLVKVTGGVGLQRIVVDLGGGAFAPGKTAESGSTSEIEFEVDGGTGGEFPAGDELRVLGTPAANALRFGGTGAFLNADADADVTTTGIEALAAEGRGGNDGLRASGDGAGGPAASVKVHLDGGEGDDVLVGGDRMDTLEGGPGNDSESGGNDADTFRQGAAADGADVLDGGGSPYDTIEYGRRSAPVRIDLDEAADDGAAGEGDNVRDSMEYLHGGAGADTIVASQTRYQPFDLAGNGGGDTLVGGANFDELVGGEGDDVLIGNDGSDTFRAGPGNDRQAGGGGGDVFHEAETAEPNGADDISGGTGADLYFAAERVAPMALTLADGLPNDGAAGEGDNVRSDVENAVTGKGADRIVGSSLANDLAGGLGDDLLDAGAGHDVIHGRGGRDRLSGSTGNDDVSGQEDGDVADGGPGDDIVRGGDADDQLTGGTDADRVLGEHGDDLLSEPAAKDGADALTGGEGRDEVSYRSRTTAVTVGLDGLAGDGAAGEGDNASAEVLTGGTAADRLTGSAVADVINGGAGDDSLDGGDGDDTLTGGPGADELQGGAGARDLASYAGRTEALSITLAGGSPDGAAGENDTVVTEDVIGGSGADRLTGSHLDNRLDGGPGADTLDGAEGADVLTGGTGTDVASYAGRTTGVAVRLDGIANDGSDPDGDRNSGEGDDVGATVENVTGSAGADWLAGDGLANTLTGGDGRDRPDGGLRGDVPDRRTGRDTAHYATRGTDLAVTIDAAAGDGADLDGDGRGEEDDRVAETIEVVEGGNGNDRLTGGAGADELRGNNGFDTLSGRGGADRLSGGAGRDTVSYAERGAAEPVKVTIDGLDDDGKADGSEHDTVDIDVENLIGGAGNDELRGSARDNQLDGGRAGEDGLFGEGGDDRLLSGPDPVDPAADGDNLWGGEGRDVADYSQRADELGLSLDGVANDGARDGSSAEALEFDDIHGDVEDIDGGRGSDIIVGNDEPNRIDGGPTHDRLVGKGEDDELIGGAGDAPDRMFGGAGDDRLEGGPGNNGYYGEDGHDTFVETLGWTGNDLYRGGAGRDTVDYGVRLDKVILDNDGVSADDGQDADRNGTPEEKDTISTDMEVLKGGRRNDVLTQTQPLPDTCAALYGGDGDDVLNGRDGVREVLQGDEGSDTLNGKGGADWLVGGPNSDVENGGEGDDHFIQGTMSSNCTGLSWGDVSGGDGSDTLNGDGGTDHVEYRRSKDTPVTVRLDTLRNDGAAGEGDIVRTEGVSAGKGDDVVIGDDGSNELLGNDGDDHVEGHGGDDLLLDKRGIDGLFGGDGKDEFWADDGDDADTLSGGSGTDFGRWDAGDTRISVP